MSQSPAEAPYLPLMMPNYKQKFFAGALLCQDADKATDLEAGCKCYKQHFGSSVGARSGWAYCLRTKYD